MTDEQMAIDHASDYADQRRMRTLSQQIGTFLTEPPTRCSVLTRDSLGRAREALEQDCADLVKVWD